MDLSGPFAIPPWFDFTATFVWALTGALIAARRRYDIAGIVAVALVSAAGGGLIRDGIFLQTKPPLFLQTWVYMALVLLAASLTNMAGSRIQRIRHFERMIAIIDALGLGAFAVAGVQLSLLAGLTIPAAAFVGVVNAVGGGVLRDVLIGRAPMIFLPGPPVALAALSSCVIYLVLVEFTSLGHLLAGAIAVAGEFVFRTASLRYGWSTRAPRGFDADTDTV
ncbi:MAG: TRIC cation channel family protein [Chloroflexota bacterium]|nr:TRIC cation channel family protein [Chloroflexota bacterium]